MSHLEQTVTNGNEVSTMGVRRYRPPEAGQLGKKERPGI